MKTLGRGKYVVGLIIFILLLAVGLDQTGTAMDAEQVGTALRSVRQAESSAPNAGRFVVPDPPIPDTPPDGPSILPDRLRIPAIKLNAPVEPVGVLANGSMGVPADDRKAGILSPWTRPGQKGNAVISGHLDNRTGPAVFFYLKRLSPGDRVFVSDVRGREFTFVVKSVEAFKTAESPLERIFGPADTPNLNMITCTGRYNRKTGDHEQRLVVFTELLARDTMAPRSR
ncbi:class F sortase [Paenibacillus xerothermodurans]|uniref:Class F sortase n=1 Tax=Paenibacillus xerothermodurans TaxID=1977292 RepID=A0A2W1P1U4_PAEXE|nr:class F sortase [Paenibacillus xerothermodurans]PZE21722.1 class F sortase [Paenibacillus xerothermodurans]